MNKRKPSERQIRIAELKADGYLTRMEASKATGRGVPGSTFDRLMEKHGVRSAVLPTTGTRCTRMYHGDDVLTLVPGGRVRETHQVLPSDEKDVLTSVTGGEHTFGEQFVCEEGDFRMAEDEQAELPLVDLPPPRPIRPRGTDPMKTTQIAAIPGTEDNYPTVFALRDGEIWAFELLGPAKHEWQKWPAIPKGGEA